MIDFSLISIAHAGIITDAPNISAVLTKVLLWLLQILGVIAFIAFVGSGLLYLLAGGNEKGIETGKKWMIASAFGILMALGAIILLSTVDTLIR